MTDQPTTEEQTLKPTCGHEAALREALDCLLPVHAGGIVIGYEPPMPIEAATVDRWRAELDRPHTVLPADRPTDTSTVPPAARTLPPGTLDSAAAGASMLDATSRTPYGMNVLAHALVQLARDGWLRTEPDTWTPPPPGDRREQLPDHLLNLIDIPSYTSTACESAELLAAAVARHPEHADELRQWEQRQRQRCRINNKYTGVICQHTAPDFTAPLTGIEVRDPCPWCESSPSLIPRHLMGEHVAAVHPEVKTGGPGIPMPDAESVIVCTTACDEQHTLDWTCAQFAGADDSGPADLTGYLAPEPPIRCATLTTAPAAPHGRYEDAIHQAFLTTATRIPGGHPRPGTSDSHVHGTGHMYDMTCALCRGDAKALAAAVFGVRDRELEALQATLTAVTAEAARRGVISIDGIRKIVKGGRR